jgi:hypothetical protein
MRTRWLALAIAYPAIAQNYTTYTSFEQLLEGRNAHYLKVTRVSDPGPSDHRAYTGFFFYQRFQFDPTGRYMLGLRIFAPDRIVLPTDRGEIGYFDKDNAWKWTKIGDTTAWDWQQGNQLQWRPKSDEILWNDRAEDNSHFVTRVYNFRTKKTRTLPRPIYELSPDGSYALTHDFERMKHGGTNYVGIEDKFKDQYAPAETGIFKMDLNTGKSQMILSIAKMAAIEYPKGPPKSGCLYFFREGLNPSGTRFIAFIKDPEAKLSKAYSMRPDGSDIKFFYDDPSHHSWQDDDTILDWGPHVGPEGGAKVPAYYLFKDDGTGRAIKMLWKTPYNGHDSYIGSSWLLTDTYVIDGYQHLFLYHLPTKKFIPLAKLKSTAGEGIFRVDLHPRFSPDGKTVSIDSSSEGLGRQMYVLDIGEILAHPPTP